MGAVSGSGYALIGLTAIVACLVAVLTFALLRFTAAARDVTKGSKTEGAEIALMSSALQEAVTKLKAQERAMAARADASERLSGEIIESLTAGLLVVGLDGEVRTLNPAGRHILQAPNGDGPYARSSEVEPLFAAIDECRASGTAILRRSVRLPAAGQGVELGVTVSPLFDAAGASNGAICLFTDLTSVRALEEQLRLKESLATVGELTAGIAHEFRNGLATIHGYSKLLDVETLPKSHRVYVEGIRAEADSLSQVVTNFLNFAKPAQLSLTRVDLGAVCERAAEEARSDAVTAGSEVAMSGEFGAVEGDEVLLRQAFSNLLRNAAEACAGAGVVPRISIRSELDRAHQVSRITVDDNGPGIPEDARERVFRPFFTSKRDGTGLGLALVQKIVVFHNGRISVGHASLGGASLQVVLPLIGD